MNPQHAGGASPVTPQDLQRAIATGRLVVIAGTGVSVAASGNPDVDGHKIATWPGLLQHGVDHCQGTHGLLTPAPAASLRTQIDSGDLDFMVAGEREGAVP